LQKFAAVAHFGLDGPAGHWRRLRDGAIESHPCHHFRIGLTSSKFKQTNKGFKQTNKRTACAGRRQIDSLSAPATLMETRDCS
jgi:hypothetical protein